MRDIKFRAWDKHLKAWAIFELGWSFDKTKGHIVFHPMPCPEISEYLEIGQYTGLKDKNGVEIYEDDIIEFRIYPNERFRIAIIKWYKYGYTIENHKGQFVETTTNTHILFLNSETNIKVCGNIHDNPKLLEPHT